MKCSECKYLYYPEYESNYTSCRVFGDETPESYERKDGEGCKCNYRQLDSIYRRNEEARMKDIEMFVKWYEKNNGVAEE